MKYCKVLSTGKVAEVRMQLKDHVVIRDFDGNVNKLKRSEVEEIDLQGECTDALTQTS